MLRARLQLERTHISAPFNGIIIAKQVDRGQFVTSGSQLAEIASADEMEIRLSPCAGPVRRKGKTNS